MDLEKIIADLVARKYASGVSEAEVAMLNRVLNGMRYSYEDAGPIWEDLDPYGWEASPP
jgi:hypothetical protein